MSYPLHSPIFHLPNNIWGEVQSKLPEGKFIFFIMSSMFGEKNAVIIHEFVNYNNENDNIHIIENAIS
jgi:hypothetical protein